MGAGLRAIAALSHLVLTAANDVGAESTEQSPFKKFNRDHTAY